MKCIPVHCIPEKSLGLNTFVKDNFSGSNNGAPFNSKSLVAELITFRPEKDKWPYHGMVARKGSIVINWIRNCVVGEGKLMKLRVPKMALV